MNNFTLNIPSNISSISVELTSESWHDNPLLRCFNEDLFEFKNRFVRKKSYYDLEFTSYEMK